MSKGKLTGINFSDEFYQGYHDGCDDPGFIDAKQPKTIKNPYSEGTQQHIDYETGYRAAID